MYFQEPHGWYIGNCKKYKHGKMGKVVQKFPQIATEKFHFGNYVKKFAVFYNYFENYVENVCCLIINI